MFKTHASKVVAGADPRVLNSMSLGFLANFTRYDADLDPRITFTRASNATYFDSTGTLQTAGSGVARANQYQDHNPATLAPLGFLIEEQRTNSIRNNTMQGAVAGTPGTVPTDWSITDGGGVTRTIVGVGVEEGIQYIDVRVQAGSAVNSFITFVGSAVVGAVSGQVWTGTTFVKLVGGAYSGISQTDIDITARNSVPAVVSDGFTIFTATTADLASQRQSVSFTMPATTAWVNLAVRIIASAAYDITLRIGLPQLELGAFATSPILTTTAAATRLADVASITGTNFSSFWNASEGTIVLGFRPPSTAIDSAPVTANGGTDANRIGFDTTPTGFGRLVVDTASVSQVLIGTSGVSQGALNKFAGAYKVNDFAISKAGAAPSTDTSGTVPTVDRLQIGSRVGAVYLNGHLQSLTYYNKRLPNQTIQSLTV
jgi:hypothetical protein